MKRSGFTVLLIVILNSLILLMPMSFCGVLAAETNVVKIACVGDSITMGIGIPAKARATRSYPALLESMLGTNRFEVQNFGSGGMIMRKKERGDVKPQNSYWNTSFIKKDEIINYKPDIIIIMLGSNDAAQDDRNPGRYWVNLDLYLQSYRWMIEKFSAIDPKPAIYMAYPPPVFPGERPRNYHREEILSREIRPGIEGLSHELNLPVIDLYTPLKDHSEWFNSRDKVHPNSAGYTNIAKIVSGFIKDKRQQASKMGGR